MSRSQARRIIRTSLAGFCILPLAACVSPDGESSGIDHGGYYDTYPAVSDTYRSREAYEDMSRWSAQDHAQNMQSIKDMGGR